MVLVPENGRFTQPAKRTPPHSQRTLMTPARKVQSHTFGLSHLSGGNHSTARSHAGAVVLPKNIVHDRCHEEETLGKKSSTVPNTSRSSPPSHPLPSPPEIALVALRWRLAWSCISSEDWKL